MWRISHDDTKRVSYYETTISRCYDIAIHFAYHITVLLIVRIEGTAKPLVGFQTLLSLPRLVRLPGLLGIVQLIGVKETYYRDLLYKAFKRY